MNRWTEKLRQEQVLTREEFAALLDARDEALLQELQEQAVQVRQQHFGESGLYPRSH